MNIASIDTTVDEYGPMDEYAYEEDEDDVKNFPLITEKEQHDREARVQAIREIVLKWKKQLLNQKTGEDQNTQILNGFRNELTGFFYLLRDVLEGEEPSKELESHELWAKLKPYFPLEDGVERIDLTQGLFRDLVEFPFTFNKKLINGFSKQNSLEDAEFLPND